MSKKVYFACAVRAGGDTSLYLEIIDAIKSAGGEVQSEVFVHDAINYGGSPLPVEEIYSRDIQMIHSADVVIADVTNPSLGVGYELAYAEKLHKPTLCLYNADSSRTLSAMVAGNPYNTVVKIRSSTLKGVVATFLAHHSE